jgi:hypothetical protein
MKRSSCSGHSPKSVRGSTTVVLTSKYVQPEPGHASSAAQDDQLGAQCVPGPSQTRNLSARRSSRRPGSRHSLGREAAITGTLRLARLWASLDGRKRSDCELRFDVYPRGMSLHRVKAPMHDARYADRRVPSRTTSTASWDRGRGRSGRSKRGSRQGKDGWRSAELVTRAPYPWTSLDPSFAALHSHARRGSKLCAARLWQD